jgi:hypothetical protein
MIEVKAPGKYPLNKIKIFLAGSIEMGIAVDWQAEVEEKLKEYDIIILNPRRKSWDSTWTQSIQNDKFRQQVEWELTALEEADFIMLYFDPNTKSPISLLELGLFNSKKIFVCCPEGFWRKGNVEIVCKRYNIPFFEDINAMLDVVKERLEEL